MTSHTRIGVSLAAVLGLVSWGCSASQPKQVEDPDPLGLGTNMAQDEDEADDAAEVATDDGTASDDDSTQGSSDAPKAASGEPRFAEGMSVSEAQAAVPPDADRLNIEQEVLATPLQDTELYEPCKIGTGHFTANVAVYDGRVVGLDLETQPKNPTLAKCLGDQIRKVRWRDKVKSVNTVEFSF